MRVLTKRLLTNVHKGTTSNQIPDFAVRTTSGLYVVTESGKFVVTQNPDEVPNFAMQTDSGKYLMTDTNKFITII